MIDLKTKLQVYTRSQYNIVKLKNKIKKNNKKKLNIQKTKKKKRQNYRMIKKEWKSGWIFSKLMIIFIYFFTSVKINFTSFHLIV